MKKNKIEKNRTKKENLRIGKKIDIKGSIITIRKLFVKIIAILGTLILSGLCFANSTQATQINAADLHYIADCGELLKYNGITVKVSYIEYINGNNHYPAYCLDKTKPGVESGEYAVSVEKAVQDVGLWRRIINGYPYKTLEELGVATKEEAFTATKQAVYCYIHGNDVNSYEAIGEAGERTLNALKQIVANAENSTETKISNVISISKDSLEWQQDDIDKNYVSKTYSATGNSSIQNYKITITKDGKNELDGIKLTDVYNVEKQEFLPAEQFKILIPIKSLTKEGNIEIKVEAPIYTKPVLYGESPDSSKQDYALSAATYEDGYGNTTDTYFKNETRIIVLKKDEETKLNLEGVEFELLDINKNVLYSGLKTDTEGKITLENLIPGEYYLKETNTIAGYQIYDELIRLQVKLNEQTTVTVNNRKTEKPTIETTRNQLSTSSSQIKKLPVTGM